MLIENYRAGVMDKLDLGYEALQAINPRLVYAAIRGFGDPRTGASPYVDWPAYDVIAQAMGGMMSITGPRGSPTKVGPGVGDTLPAALTAFGIMAAVYRANKTGKGQFVDVAMYDAVLAFCERIVYQYSYTGDSPGARGQFASVVVSVRHVSGSRRTRRDCVPDRINSGDRWRARWAEPIWWITRSIDPTRPAWRTTPKSLR